MNNYIDEHERFLKELETFMRKVKQLANASIRVYSNKIRNLLESGYSVCDLCGAADRLWEDLGPNGRKYDPKDHGNTRAAVRHVDDFVRIKLLEEVGVLNVRYTVGYQSFRPKGKHMSGYEINGGKIEIFYDIGHKKGKTTIRRISTSGLRFLIDLLETAKRKNYLASSDTCVKVEHGVLYRYDYAFAGVNGNNCNSLFEGAAVEVENLEREYSDLIQKLIP